MSKQIMTVLGPIAPEELGFTSMHEHVLMAGGWVLRKRVKEGGIKLPEDPRYPPDGPVTLENIGLIKRNPMTNWEAAEMDDEEIMQLEVADYRDSGGKALLEVGVPGIRTKVAGVKRISQTTGVHIVMSTGLYTGDSWPEEYLAMSKKEIHQYMLDEIREGIEGTDIRAGHIKIGIHDFSAREEMALRIGAEVALETGLSMTIHCGRNIADGRRVTEVLLEEGMDVSRTVIAHASNRLCINDLKLQALRPELMKLELDYCKELLDMGTNISLEFYNGSAAPHWIVLAGIIAFLKQGYAKQIVLGTDTCAKVHTSRGGGEGYGLLTRFGVPKLREFGVSDHDIRMMTETNPARILAY